MGTVPNAGYCLYASGAYGLPNLFVCGAAAKALSSSVSAGAAVAPATVTSAVDRRGPLRQRRDAVAARRQVEPERAVGAGHRHPRRRRGDDERGHLRMDVAEHADHARRVNVRLFDGAGAIEPEVERLPAATARTRCGRSGRRSGTAPSAPTGTPSTRGMNVLFCCVDRERAAPARGGALPGRAARHRRPPAPRRRPAAPRVDDRARQHVGAARRRAARTWHSRRRRSVIEWSWSSRTVASAPQPPAAAPLAAVVVRTSREHRVHDDGSRGCGPTRSGSAATCIRPTPPLRASASTITLPNALVLRRRPARPTPSGRRSSAGAAVERHAAMRREPRFDPAALGASRLLHARRRRHRCCRRRRPRRRRRPARPAR